MRRFSLAVVVTVAAIVMAACSSTAPESASSNGSVGSQATQSDGDAGSGEADSEEEGKSGSNQPEEEIAPDVRVAALNEAVAAGTFGTVEPTSGTPAAGWTGEQVLNSKTDDWEPAVAADPHAPYVYLLTTRFGAKKICPSNCPSPYLPLAISKNGGKTWSDEVPICTCKGSTEQDDPTIEVVPKTGDVYSAFLDGDANNGYSAVFTKSTNHGKTWTKPVHVYGKVGWTDKPEITMSPNGKNVYVAWNGPSGGDSYVGVSHNYGKTWTQNKTTNSDKYFYAYDGTVAPGGTVVFSEAALVYSGHPLSAGPTVRFYAVISRDKGKSWTKVLVATLKRGESCVADGCGNDFYIGQSSVADNHRGDLFFTYEGAKKLDGPMQVYVSTSNNDGRSWGHQTALSVKGENATGPRIDVGNGGNPRLWYVQTSGSDNPDAWNTWYRRAEDSGRTWRKPVRLSNSPTGAGYKTAQGYQEIYGDYGEIAVTNLGKTVATWGEGFSYTGPGGTWIAVQK